MGRALNTTRRVSLLRLNNGQSQRWPLPIFTARPQYIAESESDNPHRKVGADPW